MHFIPKKMATGKLKYSLKTRLAVFYALLLILSVGFIGYFSYWNIWDLFFRNEAHHLRALAKPVVAEWLQTYHLNANDSVSKYFSRENASVLAKNLTSRYVAAVVVDKKGNILANGKQLPEEPIPPTINRGYLKKAFSGANEITYWTKVNGKPVLVALIPLRVNPIHSKVFAVLQISTGLSPMNKLLFQYAIRQWGAVFLVVLFGILFGTRIIEWSLKDLNRLTQICREISKGNFSRFASMSHRKDEIGALAISFNEMVNKLENLIFSQKRFVANAAHELLTPLTGLRGSLDIMLRGAGDDLSSRNRLLKGMFSEVNRLIRTCDRLLSLSKLENTKVAHIRRVDLTAFFSDFEQQARQLAPKCEIVLDNGPPVSPMADSDLLSEVCFNLFSNALSYGSEYGPVNISWKLITGFVEISFEDKGIGMDQETLKHVFEPFFSGPSKGSIPKGTGLGLTLALAMMKAQGGTLKIKSTPNKGTVVYLTLPLN